MFGTQLEYSRLGDFRPETFSIKKRAVCQCVIDHTGHHGYDPAWNETCLRFAEKTDYKETQNLKRYSVKDRPNYADKDKILKRIDEIKSINKQFLMKSETDDYLLSFRTFRNAPRHMN